jgi:hypothetical protein
VKQPNFIPLTGEMPLGSLVQCETVAQRIMYKKGLPMTTVPRIVRGTSRLVNHPRLVRVGPEPKAIRQTTGKN